MVISASRRTDIPAFYGEWLYKRLLAREVQVRNPFNSSQISLISLDPSAVDCIVFWTKNPEPFFQYLQPVRDAGYPFYFHFTLNAYGPDVEPGTGDKAHLIDVFKQLSEKIGKERVIWRYDPILYSQIYNNSFHMKQFSQLCTELAPYCEKCVISFLDVYRHISKNLDNQQLWRPSDTDQITLVKYISETAGDSGLVVTSCGEARDFSDLGVRPNACIDTALIERITNKTLPYKKDPGQRPGCMCHISKDIGSYGSCPHSCVYCYANRTRNNSIHTIHDPDLPLLIGTSGI